MSNFYVEDIETEDGVFPSIETYQHWLGIKDELKEEKDKMKPLVRNSARKYEGIPGVQSMQTADEICLNVCQRSKSFTIKADNYLQD